MNSVIALAAVGCGIWASVRPWQVLRQQQSATAKSVADMRAIERNRELLVRQEARYRSSLGREELARARGLLPKNESFVAP